MSPLYNAQYPPPFLAIGAPLHTFLVFNAEALVVNEFSQQVSLPMAAVAGQKGIRVEIDFSANPGVYEIDVMEADNDPAGSLEYQQVPAGGQLNTVTAGPNGASTHVSTDLIPVAGQFVCLFVRTAPANACTCTARITRAA